MATDRVGGRAVRPARSRPLILDSAVLIGLGRADGRARVAVELAMRHGQPVIVPAVVLAEVLRGSPRDAPVHRLLKRIARVVAVDQHIGAAAGRLLGAVGGSSTIDALVVASAVDIGGGTILTGDLGDLRPLAAAAGPTVGVVGF